MNTRGQERIKFKMEIDENIIGRKVIRHDQLSKPAKHKDEQSQK
jgi:hypothetical protein